MAKKGNVVRMKATTEDFEKGSQDQGEFVVPDPGFYILQLKEANPGFSQDEKTGEPDKNRPRVECIYEITGVGTEDAPVTENYGNVWDYVSFSESSGFRRGAFLRAFGFSDGTEDFDGDVDLDEAIGRKVLARLRRQKGRTKDDPPRAKIATLLPYEDRDMAGAFGGDDDDAQGEGPWEGNGEDEEDAEDYTMEELMALEPKELGRIAKEEFELEPSEFVVKVRGKANVEKSKQKLAQAILDAQEEDAGEGGEDPF